MRLALILASTGQLLLEGSAKDYEYLKRSADTVNGVDDREEWALLQVSESEAIDSSRGQA